ncbi:MAG: alanine/ornithine racemase family PLP-dependent enzyme [Bacteroidales bacterium]|nr:alanine/ornithine racemase family PLP-dependent enzyme [Bacteroidales bacterium]MDD3384167.1 alanine/ornithine racemase family PLP-dependent enzyme [Bacteroidales bacterium]MDD3870821.1 alanine/ornithine racemase family PLP-dependent enzyme [Bacteroidales bacterium]MDD4812347.1 alanine/ornithine racemase family PLP-dependent enzyme [Bacteroidales bacterium]
MAFITLNVEKLKSNFEYLDKLFKKKNIQWSVVTKMLCGNRDYLQELLKLNIKQVCDSRVSNLKRIKQINPEIETIYIKPPAKRAVKSIVQYADISMNTEVETIKLLSEEAQKQDRIHKVIIMIEMGELREGIMRDDLIDFYHQIFRLKNIQVVGIGTNLSCLYGVLPNHDKLIQLSLYQQLIEAKFNKKMQYVSGGSSVTIPLIFKNLLPKGINHFRVGETLYLGTDVYNNKPLKKMATDAFLLYAEIIELIEKPQKPDGEMGTNVDGNSVTFDESLAGKTSYRALIDIGLLDVDEKHLMPNDPNISIVGGSSDMFVIDLDDNIKNYKVGDLLEFKLDYMGTLRILNSKYIDKRVTRGN